MRNRRSANSGKAALWPRKRRIRRFSKQPKCKICHRKIDMGSLCYYCRKRKTS